jgi:hypothetical protein
MPPVIVCRWSGTYNQHAVSDVWISVNRPYPLTGFDHGHLFIGFKIDQSGAASRPLPGYEKQAAACRTGCT